MTRARRIGASVAERGFTLLEIMIAVAVLALMMIMAYGTTRNTMRAKKKFESMQQRNREVRIALSRIVKDFGSAYISGNEDRNLNDTRTFFVGSSSGDFDTVRFSTLTHTPLFANANESDETVVEYFSERDSEAHEQENLLRRELRRPGPERYDSLPAEVDVALNDVTKFKLEYYDARDREWREAWDTQNTDGNAPRVPDRVRVAVSFKDDQGKEVTVVTQARIYLQEMVQGYAN